MKGVVLTVAAPQRLHVLGVASVGGAHEEPAQLSHLQHSLQVHIGEALLRVVVRLVDAAEYVVAGQIGTELDAAIAIVAANADACVVLQARVVEEQLIGARIALVGVAEGDEDSQDIVK